MKIRINAKTGEILAVYDDKLLPIFRKLNGGELTNKQIIRASHVEPSMHGGFDADMTPIGGPKSLAEDLGLKSFETHAKAIDAEKEWLDKNLSTKCLAMKQIR